MIVSSDERITVGLERPDFSNNVPLEVPGFILHLAEQMEIHWAELGSAIEGPQAAALNGRLPASSLAAIPGGRLEKSAARAWNDMRAYIGKRHGVWIRPLGANSSYRLYAAQLYFWRLYQAGRGNVAAYPGTSNHGWGRAVDVATTTMAYYIRKYGHLFGWSHAEGARVNEWWHFTYVGGYKAKPARDPLWYMTPRERRLIREYNDLRKLKKPTAKQRARRKAVWHWLKDQRERIWRAAESKTGNTPGWNRWHRKARYRTLKKYTS